MAKLKDAQLRAWVNAGKPISGKSDGDGLTFTLSASSTASWTLRYRIGGKARELTLGNYPDIPLVKARKLATAERVRVDQGIDVSAEKRTRIRKALSDSRRQTFKALAEEWMKRNIESRVKHPEVVRGALRKHVFPRLGAIPSDEVTPADVDTVLRRIVDAGAPTTANDVLRYIRKICSYGVKRRLLPSNPAADFTCADAGGTEKGRDRALSRDELAGLFKAMKATLNLGRDNYLTFLILLATCVRKTELVAAPWSEFELKRGVWHLAGERTKTKQPIDIPLAASVVGWLEELKTLSAGSEYVLPARIYRKQRQRFPHISPDTLNVALKRVRHRLEHFTIHDMRRTARTQLAGLGVSREVAERALNHALGGVEGTYNQHDYFKERKHALALWADLLTALESGKRQTVVPITRPKIGRA